MNFFIRNPAENPFFDWLGCLVKFMVYHLMYLHQMLAFLLILIMYCIVAQAERNLSFVPCTIPKPAVEQRRLFVITCETRLNDLYYRAWNATSEGIRDSGAFFKNVCDGIEWSGFLTKPTAYLRHVDRIMDIFSNNSLNYVMIMDSDTFWSASHVSDIWHKYDCARGSRDMLVSSEMTCWIGSFCHITQIRKYYGIPGFYPSYSPFVNSGVIMGRIDLIRDMLAYTLARNASFVMLHGTKYSFHDQYAVTDYAMKVAPHLMAVDYHQQLIGSYFVAATDEPALGSICYDREGGLAYNCQSQTPIMYKEGHFIHDNVTCEAYRRVWQGMPKQLEVESLATRPAIWHGNGR